MNMDKLLKHINEIDKNNNVEDNLYVKNIIVNKDKAYNKTVPYIATEKWIRQLGPRLLIKSFI